ncbi:MAG: sigma-70 family RNA polymerase sigma factor [Chloroflexota bacterium]|nr:sigma-70 family RNA polymerase sigma factor [Dehalococcoidia bacterium]MDW8254493.1 sigma-70 family RNA polymerase sigma factor [Chloroflexota bacterium]
MDREGTDEYWVGRALRDPEAFAVLVERYQGRIFALCYRMTGNSDDAADLAQETFIRAYRGLKTFRLDARFSPWLYKIAANLCLNYWKGKAQRPEEGLDEHLRATDLSPERRVEQQELRELLTEAIAELPPNYRAAIVLRHLHDLAYEDIAETLGVPLGTVKTWLFRARERLQQRLAPVRG